MNFASIDNTLYNILAVQQFLNMINSAFQTAFTALKTANPSATQFVNAPQMVYNSSTQLFSLVVDRFAWSAGDPLFPSIWFCSSLMEKFSNLMNVRVSWNSGTGRDCRLVVQDLGSNVSTNPIPGAFVSTLTTALTQNGSTNSLAVGALTSSIQSGVAITVTSSKTNGGQPISQTFVTSALASAAAVSISVAVSTASYAFEIGSVVSIYQPQQLTMTSACIDVVDWLSIRRVMLTSDTLGVRPEYFPSSAAPGNTSSITPGVTQSINMVTDFYISPPSNLTSFNTLIYNATVYREIDLIGDMPLNRLDLTFQTVDSDGNVAPLMINPGKSVDIKIMLRPKRYFPLEMVTLKTPVEDEKHGGRLIDTRLAKRARLR